MTQLFRPGFEVGEHVDGTLGWPQSRRSAWRMCSLAAAGGALLHSKTMLGILPKKHEIYIEIWTSMRMLLECYRMLLCKVIIHMDFFGSTNLIVLNCVCKLIPRSERQWIIVPSSVFETEEHPQKGTPRTYTLESEERTEKEPKNCHSDRFWCFWQFQQFRLWKFSGVPLSHPGHPPSLGWQDVAPDMSALNSNCFRFKGGTQMILTSNWKIFFLRIAKICVLLRPESVWRRTIPRKFGGGLDLPARYPRAGASRKLRWMLQVVFWQFYMVMWMHVNRTWYKWDPNTCDIYLRNPQTCPSFPQKPTNLFDSFWSVPAHVSLSSLHFCLAPGAQQTNNGQVLCNLNDSRKLAVLPLMKVLEALARGPSCGQRNTLNQMGSIHICIISFVLVTPPNYMFGYVWSFMMI